MKLKLDLHEIYSDKDQMQRALTDIIRDAKRKHVKIIEIVTGKGSGQLKKSVLRFIEKTYNGQYHRIEKDDKNWGHIFIHFRYAKE